MLLDTAKKDESSHEGEGERGKQEHCPNSIEALLSKSPEKTIQAKLLLILFVSGTAFMVFYSFYGLLDQ